MSVVARKRQHRTTYYVVVTWKRRRIWERIGSDRREAERTDARYTKEIKGGTFQPKPQRGGTVRSYARAWMANRDARDVETEAGYLERYVLSRDWFASLHLDAVRPPHIDRLVRELEGQVSKATGKPLGPKTVANIYGIVRTMFRRAVRDEIVDRDPCAVPPDGLVRSSQPGARVPYGNDAIRLLLTHPAVPPHARMFAALAILTGMREGELCGRRWKDYNPEARPLGCLTVATQYGGQPLKTSKRAGDRPRQVPVHPSLARALEWWKREGFELVYRRKPRPDDYIVPQADGSHHTKSTAYKMWRRACALAGVDNLSLHSTRHTFVTLCRRGGARPDVLERVTHNARGTILDVYTHLDWDPLCEAVLCLTVDATVDAALPTSGIVVEAPGIEHGRYAGTTRNLLTEGESASGEEPPSSAASREAAADRAARQLPPGYEATRLELDGRSARIALEPGDTPATVNARLAKAGRALGASARRSGGRPS